MLTKSSKSKSHAPSSDLSDPKVNVTSILQGIHLVRVATQVQMIAFLNLLDEWLREHPKVRPNLSGFDLSLT